METYSYEQILRAVGKVLDTAEARSVAVRETASGLVIEAVTTEAPLSLDLDLADLTTLLDWASTAETTPSYARASASDEGTLAHFLERHALVGASR